MFCSRLSLCPLWPIIVMSMTAVRLLKNGSEIFPAMFDSIDRAVICVGLEMYIFADDGTGRAFRDCLVSAAKRGVQVKVMVDAVGSWSLPESFWDELRNAGGVARPFRPVSRGMFFFRNHRKVLLVDDHVAYIGGMNIADEYFLGSGGEPAWRDNALEITGQAVKRIKCSFDRMWTRAEMPFRKVVLSLRRVRRTSEQSGSGSLHFLESGPEDPMR
jgi:cardiolipin synthase